MNLKVELTVDEIEEALKRYVANKITIAEYSPSDVQFVYDGQEDPNDYIAQTIDGAFVTLEISRPPALLSEIVALEISGELSPSHSLAPEGWRSV